MAGCVNLCTYFDRAYLPQGVALLRSMARHAADWRLWVLALDDWTAQLMGALARQPAYAGRVEVGSLADLAAWDAEAARSRRATRAERIFTLTPAWTRYVLASAAPADLAYIDADCYFFSDPAPLYAEVERASIAVIPHRWTPAHAERLRSNGQYNVGWVYFRNDAAGHACLEAWRRRCLDWRPSVDQPRFSDQVFLDEWPARHGAHVVAHPGANLAPWSQGQYRYMLERRAGAERVVIEQDQIRDGVLEARREAVLFYHFHELRIRPDRSIYRTGYVLAPLVERLYADYEAELGDVIQRLA